MIDLIRRKKELLNAYNNLCSCYGDIISEQTKTINRLKDLLKECREVIKDVDTYCTKNADEGYILIYRIDNAIGEKK